MIDTTNLTQTASAAVLQSDGKIVAVGNSQTNFFCLARYNTDGSPDSTFNGGIPVVDATGKTLAAYAGLLQPDGKMVAVGASYLDSFCLARYNINGSVDPTFNGGIPVVDTTGATFAANAAALQPDGKIIAGGISQTDLFCLIRYHTDGSIDQSFHGGTPVIDTTGLTQGINAMLLQPDGKIVAAGNSQTNFFCLARYNTDGSPDSTFNGGIPVVDTSGLTQAINAVLLQPDGKIVAVGNNQTDESSCLARYNTDGSPDSTFNGGIPVVDTTGITLSANAALLQPDRKIVVVGVSQGDEFCLARYNTDGSVDSTFNGGIPVSGPETTSVASAALLQPDGKIVAVGESGGGFFCLARYINPFTLASFTASYGEVGML